jgi:subtilisin
LRQGVQGTTDANGEVHLNLSASTIDRLYVYAPAGYWGAYRSRLAVNSPIPIDLMPVDLAYQDCLRFYYGATNFDGTVGVKVGIIDSGVGPHTDLNINTGDSRNTVTGEPASDFEDGGSHGTHVAGIVGSNGAPGTGLRGMAPGVEMVALRVFPAHGGASNYAILKAMIYAADAGCDIINLSLGGGPPDPIVREAIDDARDQGMLVVAAAGNGGRKPVSFPAAYNRVIAVSAMGREGTFPQDSLDEADVLRPPTSTVDADEFIAAFSNIGIEINCTGPGVGVLSTLPNNAFGPMSGTSMASPAVAGAAACLLSQNSQIHSMPRGDQRADAIWNLLVHNCSRRGFGAQFEGAGLPDPAVV